MVTETTQHEIVIINRQNASYVIFALHLHHPQTRGIKQMESKNLENLF